MNKPVLTFCNKALSQLQKVASLSKHSSVLISVSGGGCNGLSYKIEPLHVQPHEMDVVMNKTGMDIVVCGRSLLYLIDAKVSWLEDHMGSRFDFSNPNASSKCGCGTTFSIKK